MNHLGKYEILEELSRDSTCCVYRAHDRVLEREAVLKAFPAQGVSLAIKRLFYRELAAAAKLSHPNIRSIYDFAEQDDFVYVAMETIDGEDIRQIIAGGRALDLEAKIRVMGEVCDGLAHAHEKGVTHYALQPANVFILKSGEVKISDFGIGQGLAARTGSFSAAATAYMAPEQLRGIRGTPRSDIFSAAVIFYELLTGTYPFQADDVVREILQVEPTPITEINAEVPQRLAEILVKALAKESTKRLQSAAQFADAIRTGNLDVQLPDTSIQADPERDDEYSLEETNGSVPQVVDTIPTEEQQAAGTDDSSSPATVTDGFTELKKRLPPPAPRICLTCGKTNAADAILCESCGIRFPSSGIVRRRSVAVPPPAVQSAQKTTVQEPVPPQSESISLRRPRGLVILAVTLIVVLISARYGFNRVVGARAGAARARTENASDVALVDDIRYWEGQNSVRVVVQLNGDVNVKQGEASPPDRVFIDMTPATLNPTLVSKKWPVKSGLLQNLRVEQHDKTSVRLGLDVGTVGRVTSFQLSDPSRLVIDVIGDPAFLTKRAGENSNEAPHSASTGSNSEAANITPPQPTNSVEQSLIRALGLKAVRVAIDAGHGGRDTGTVSPHGLAESELVLDIARRLKQLVEKSLGATVVMIRDEDVFVPLEQRTAIAIEQNADLFISIHANASRLPDTTGVETYFLNFPNSGEALEIAARENATSQSSIHQLQDLVKRITVRANTEVSRQLAEHVQEALVRNRSRDDRGVKQAPFVVLVGANIPAILTEIGFISNTKDERLLQSPQYRQEVAAALFDGIRSYSETLSR